MFSQQLKRFPANMQQRCFNTAQFTLRQLNRQSCPAKRKNIAGRRTYFTYCQVEISQTSTPRRQIWYSSKYFTTKLPSNTAASHMKYQSVGYSSNQQQPIQQPGPPSDYGAVTDDHWGPYIMKRIHKLEESSRWHGYNILRWGVSGLVALFVMIYLFREPLKDNVADEVADVASRSMADENVVLKAHAMTKDVLQRLVSEPETINLASDFVAQVLQNEQLRMTAVDFISSVLNHEDTQAKVKELTWNTINTMLNNDEMKMVLLNFIKSLINDPQTKEACQELLVSLTKDPDIQEIIADFFKSVLASPDFQMEATLLGREVTNNVVLDTDIQKQTGDALWNAVKYGMTPSWFRGE